MRHSLSFLICVLTNDFASPRSYMRYFAERCDFTWLTGKAAAILIVRRSEKIMILYTHKRRNGSFMTYRFASYTERQSERPRVRNSSMSVYHVQGACLSPYIALFTLYT